LEKSEQVFKILKRNRLVGLLTPESVDQCVAAHEILHPYGVVLEVAMRSEYALDGMKAVLEKYPDALVLAGTVMTRQQAEDAIQAGAAGIVSADYVPSVVEVCVRHDVMCVPGGLSDAGKQLAQKAELYGCNLDELRSKYPYQWVYKLFPAYSAGRSNVGIAVSWKGPYRDLVVLYTGGVNAGNLRELVEQDPNGVYCGSALTESVEQPDRMRETVEKWLHIVRGRKEDETEALLKREGAKPPGKVVTFGEIMLRLSPPDRLRFGQARSYDAVFGGAEANVAVSLANFGLPAVFVTAVPGHEIGQAAVNAVRAFGVEVTHILRQGGRIGLYFLEHGASQRPPKVIYDRAGSAFSEVKRSTFDWEEILRDATWFHWTGITPALGDDAAEVTWEALRTAKKMGIMVSVDLNYRKALWSKERARAVMTPLMEYVDVYIGNEEDADAVFSIEAKGFNAKSGQLEQAAYEEVARQLAGRFGFQKAVITLRKSVSASENVWSACMYNGKDFLHSRKYRIQIIDRVGAGDAFSAGLIYGILSGMGDREALEFAVAAGCLKQTMQGDFNLASVREVEQLVNGEVSGRIQR
jgi:2-dehydro-3-deoxygluconokinase